MEEQEKTAVDNAKDILEQVIRLSNSVVDLKQSNKEKDKEIYRLQRIIDKKEENKEEVEELKEKIVKLEDILAKIRYLTFINE